jgi:hypothetical protein
MPLFRLPKGWIMRFGLCTAPALAVGMLLFCFYLLTVGSTALAQSAGQASSPVDTTDGKAVFTRDDGLVANTVTALLRDDRVLWVGTTAGLSRYTLLGRNAGLIWETLSQKDGLADDAVKDLWSDDAGGLWVAHPDGQISHLNGNSWTTYESVTQTLSQAYKQIIDNHAAGPLWSIEEGGRVWTLADGTVGYYVGAVWRPYGEDAGIPSGRLVAVWTGDGAWVASENGQIGYFDGANWTVFSNAFDAVQRNYETIVASGPVNGALWVVDQDGAIWVRNAFNQRSPQPDVRRFAEGRWTNYGIGDGMASGFVEELRLDDQGRVWARHAADETGQGGGLSLNIGEDPDQVQGTDSWIDITPALSGNVTDFSPDGSGGVWIGSSYLPQTGGVPVGGLTFVNLDTWQRFPLNTLGGAAISATWLDEDDTLWLGQAGDARLGLSGGLWRYRPAQGTRAARWTPVSGLLDDDIRDMWGDGQGNLWVATEGGVNRIVLRNRKIFSYTQAIRPDRITGDAQGTVWALVQGEEGAVWQWDGSVWVNHTASEGLRAGSFNDMQVTADGQVYLASDRGLDIWDGKKWSTFSALPGRHVKQVWQDDTGDLWLSSEITPGRPFNLSFNQGDGWQTVLNENDSRGMGSEPLALLRDGRQVAWLGTPLGLFIYEPDADAQWRGLGPVEGLPAGPVPALYEDTSGTVWVAVGEQVYRTDTPTCQLAGAPPTRQTGEPPQVGESSQQGSPQECGSWVQFEPGVGTVTQITAGPAGAVLLTGEAGTALYRPDYPELRLDGVTNLISGETVDGQEPVMLTIGRNAVRVDLAAIVPTLPARELSYRYRLEGIDQGWRLVPVQSLGDKQGSLTYAGMPGGVYTLTAAVRTDALNSSPEISFTLYVLSRSPNLSLDAASIAGRPADQPGALRSHVGQPIQIRLSGDDDQLEPLTYRYRIEGMGGNWTTTASSEISFTLAAAGTYTFVATALDSEGQLSEPVGSQITVSEAAQAQTSEELPVEMIAAVLGALAVLSVGSAVFLFIRRKRRESW